MPPTPAFSGLRLSFLTAALKTYSESPIGEDWESFIQWTIRQMHKRFPVTLGDKDPTQAELALVNDDVADPEEPLPEQGTAEYEEAAKANQEMGVKKKALSNVSHLANDRSRLIQRQFHPENPSLAALPWPRCKDREQTLAYD